VVVKILIQNIESRKFLCGSGRWSSDCREAESFLSATHALYVAKMEAVGSFQIVLYSPTYFRLKPILKHEGLHDESLESLLPA
jgi:hypothetical protein